MTPTKLRIAILIPLILLGWILTTMVGISLGMPWMSFVLGLMWGFLAVDFSWKIVREIK